MHLLLYFINNYYLNFQLLILDWKKIANKIGKFVKKAFEFLNCVFPQISGLVGCGKDIAKSSASCLKGKSNCHISFGGSNSKCMHLFWIDERTIYVVNSECGHFYLRAYSVIYKF